MSAQVYEENMVRCDACDRPFHLPKTIDTGQEFAGFVAGKGASILVGPEHALHVCDDTPRELQALALRLAGEWFAAVNAVKG